MFTGIITDIGIVEKIEARGDVRFTVRTSYDTASIAMGASIACSGACLTVVEKGKNSFSVDVSPETLSRTTMDEWTIGTKVNLERALRMGDELGGHLVTGHVDGLATILSVIPMNMGIQKSTELDSRLRGNDNAMPVSHVIKLEAPLELARFIAEKGSVTLNGISLTVNKVEDTRFYVNIIPHTWVSTTLSEAKAGDRLNLEIDLIARYLARYNETRTL